MNPVSMDVNRIEDHAGKSKNLKGSIFEIPLASDKDKKDNVKDKADIHLLSILSSENKIKENDGSPKDTDSGSKIGKRSEKDKNNSDKDRQKLNKDTTEVPLANYFISKEPSQIAVPNSEDKIQSIKDPKKVKDPQEIEKDKMPDNHKEVRVPPLTNDSGIDLDQIENVKNNDALGKSPTIEFKPFPQINSDVQASSKDAISSDKIIDSEKFSSKSSLDPSVNSFPVQKTNLKKNNQTKTKDTKAQINEARSQNEAKTQISSRVSQVQIRDDKARDSVSTDGNDSKVLSYQDVHFTSSDPSDRLNLNLKNFVTENKNVDSKQVQIQTNLSDMSNSNNAPDQKLFDTVNVKIQNLVKENFTGQNFKIEIDGKKVNYNFNDARIYASLPQSSRGENFKETNVPDKSEGPVSKITDFIVKSLKEQKLPVRVEIQLNPPSLGKIEISLTEDGGKTTLIINSANDKTQEMLKNAIPVIVDRLSNLNFNIVNVQVNGQELYQNNSNGDSQRKDERDRKSNQEKEKFGELFKKEV